MLWCALLLVATQVLVALAEDRTQPAGVWFKAKGMYVTYYLEENFKGDFHTKFYDAYGCYNLPPELDNKVSSIRTGLDGTGAVHFFEHKNCEGPSFSSAPEAKLESVFGFNNLISSVDYSYALDETSRQMRQRLRKQKGHLLPGGSTSN